MSSNMRELTVHNQNVDGNKNNAKNVLINKTTTLYMHTHPFWYISRPTSKTTNFMFYGGH